MIQVNTALNEQRIKDEITNAIGRIESNAKNGKTETEIVVDKDIYDKVIRGIDNALDKDGTKYQWAVVRPSYRNQYGQVIYPISEDYGDSRMRKLRILS